MITRAVQGIEREGETDFRKHVLDKYPDLFTAFKYHEGYYIEKPRVDVSKPSEENTRRLFITPTRVYVLAYDNPKVLQSQISNNVMDWIRDIEDSIELGTQINTLIPVNNTLTSGVRNIKCSSIDQMSTDEVRAIETLLDEKSVLEMV